MLDNSYTITVAGDFMSYEFDSVGPKGIIKKIVQYSRIADSDYFNLGFGDKYYDSNDFSDLVVTNNGDRKKVLLTVAQTVLDFTRIYPDALVVAGGSTNARTRLYRILIANNLSIIQQYFKVFGLLDGGWQPFVKDTNYLVFLVIRKRIILDYERIKA